MHDGNDFRFHAPIFILTGGVPERIETVSQARDWAHRLTVAPAPLLARQTRDQLQQLLESNDPQAARRGRELIAALLERIGARHDPFANLHFVGGPINEAHLGAVRYQALINERPLVVSIAARVLDDLGADIPEEYPQVAETHRELLEKMARKALNDGKPLRDYEAVLVLERDDMLGRP